MLLVCNDCGAKGIMICKANQGYSVGEQLYVGLRSDNDQGRTRSIVEADISKEKPSDFLETNCFVIDIIAQEKSIKYHNKESKFPLLGFLGKTSMLIFCVHVFFLIIFGVFSLLNDYEETLYLGESKFGFSFRFPCFQ